MGLYEKHGVKEYWIVDLSEKVIEQYLLKNNKLKLLATAGMSQDFSAMVIEVLKFPVKNVFGKKSPFNLL